MKTISYTIYTTILIFLMPWCIGQLNSQSIDTTKLNRGGFEISARIGTAVPVSNYDRFMNNRLPNDFFFNTNVESHYSAGAEARYIVKSNRRIHTFFTLGYLYQSMEWDFDVHYEGVGERTKVTSSDLQYNEHSLEATLGARMYAYDRSEDFNIYFQGEVGFSLPVSYTLEIDSEMEFVNENGSTESIGKYSYTKSEWWSESHADFDGLTISGVLPLKFSASVGLMWTTASERDYYVEIGYQINNNFYDEFDTGFYKFYYRRASYNHYFKIGMSLF